MERKYLDLDGLKRVIENSKDLFSENGHIHNTSDIANLDNILNSLAEKQSYAGIVNFPLCWEARQCVYRYSGKQDLSMG